MLKEAKRKLSQLPLPTCLLPPRAPSPSLPQPREFLQGLGSGQSILFGNMGTSSDQDKDGDHQMPKGLRWERKNQDQLGQGEDFVLLAQARTCLTYL